ncbi:MAG: class I SAM-dependent methyltransferase [Planctomycetes bacterium]|nr:class I SAM-dependent methyltransferase [Planctomycetota bacterium]
MVAVPSVSLTRSSATSGGAVSQHRNWLEHAGPLLNQANGFDVIDCQRCQFTHVVPLPQQDQLEQIYRTEYYTTVKPTYFERTAEDLEWWNAVYDEWYAEFERHLSSDRRRILDVGSGPGFFLRRGTERGWTIQGIEPSKQAAAHARSLGLEVIIDFLTADTAKQLGGFDVVHLHEVLEHLPSPVETLRLAHGLLNPGGLLSVVVPNDYNPLQALVQQQRNGAPWWVVPPHHLNYFSGKSLARLVRKAQFAVLRRTTTFPLELFLLMGEDYVGDDTVGRSIHGKRKRLELALCAGPLQSAKRRIYAALARLGIGREVVLLARRAA